MQALYQADVSRFTIEDALDNVFEEEKLIAETKDFAGKLAKTAWKQKDEIDHLITKHSKDWRLDRMGSVDRNILRLAFSELLVKETPHQIVVDEAVELAKKYSSPEAAKFINGILGGYLKSSPLSDKI